MPLKCKFEAMTLIRVMMKYTYCISYPFQDSVCALFISEQPSYINSNMREACMSIINLPNVSGPKQPAACEAL